MTARLDGLGQVNFNDLIMQRIGEIPLPEPVVDPYARPNQPSRSFWHSSGISSYRDGRMEFGTEYDVRRVLIGSEFELIYSFLNRLNYSDFYIHQFAPQGGLKDRFHFLQREPDKPMHKSWQGRSFGGILDNKSLYFGRTLNSDEELAVKKIAIEPLAQVALLGQVTKINPKEQRQIDDNEARRIKDAKELQRDLEAISRAQRKAAAEAHRIILY